MNGTAQLVITPETQHTYDIYLAKHLPIYTSSGHGAKLLLLWCCSNHLLNVSPIFSLLISVLVSNIPREKYISLLCVSLQ